MHEDGEGENRWRHTRVFAADAESEVCRPNLFRVDGNAKQLQLAAGALAVLGSVGVVLGAALPWLETGRAKRSVFTMARIASEIGVLDTSTRRAAVAVLLFTPVVASVVVLLIGLARPRLAGAVALPLGVAGLGAGTIGTKFSPNHLIGPYVCLGAGVVCLVGAWGLVFLSPHAEDRAVTHGGARERWNS